jgi:hypothetical protein
MLTMKLMVMSKLMWEKKNYMEKSVAGTGNGFEQAQGHQLRAFKLTMKLMVTPEFKWKEKKLSRKKPVPLPAVAVTKSKCMSNELTCSHSSSLIAQYSHEKN